MKKCKKCGAEIANNAKHCPKCGASFGLPGYVKVLIVLGVVFVCLFGCVAACSKGVSDAVDAVDDSIKETENEYKDVNGKTEFKVNETFENKHFKLTMTAVDDNWTGYDSYSKPKDGKKIVKVTLNAENIGSDSSDISSLYFKCYADDVVVDEYYWSGDHEFGGTISSGKKTAGSLYYEVPKDAKKVVLEYEPSVLDDEYQVSFNIQ